MKLNINFLNPDDKLLFAKVLNRVSFCQKRHEAVFTDFFDPVRIEQFSQLVRKEFDVQQIAFGGYDGAERQIIGFFPNTTEPQINAFPIEILEINYNKKFSKNLTHRDYLGSVLGLGIERFKIGDILLNENSTVVFVHKDISSYILHNLEKVGNTKVSIQIRETTEPFQADTDEKQMNIITASLRLDSMISSIFRISRGKASDLIKAEKVFVNWKTFSSVSKNISIGDIIVLRGHGRAKINEITSKTKKDRLVINVTIW